jgi:beta-1,2-mannobiose phosphorylase / 1,2-beta-oligomannan phosphorylase
MIQHDALFVRHAANPILSAKDWPYSMNSVFNSGATLLADGTTLLLCRVEDRRGHSHLCAARSANGVDGWQIDKEPTFPADPERYPEELWGVEDPRITYMPELDITPSTKLMTLLNWRRIGRDVRKNSSSPP